VRVCAVSRSISPDIPEIASTHSTMTMVIGGKTWIGVMSDPKSREILIYPLLVIFVRLYLTPISQAVGNVYDFVLFAH